MPNANIIKRTIYPAPCGLLHVVGLGSRALVSSSRAQCPSDAPAGGAGAPRLRHGDNATARHQIARGPATGVRRGGGAHTRMDRRMSWIAAGITTSMMYVFTPASLSWMLSMTSISNGRMSAPLLPASIPSRAMLSESGVVTVWRGSSLDVLHDWARTKRPPWNA